MHNHKVEKDVKEVEQPRLSSRPARSLADGRDSPILHGAPESVSAALCHVDKNRAVQAQQAENGVDLKGEVHTSEACSKDVRPIGGAPISCVQHDLNAKKAVDYKSLDVVPPPQQPTVRYHLVGNFGTRNDSNFWADLIEQQRRRHGTNGLRQLWDAFRKDVLKAEQPSAPSWNLVWDAFFQLGFQDRAILTQILRYHILHLDVEDGHSWPRLYIAIMQYIIVFDPQWTRWWHVRLRKRFEPSSHLYLSMLENVLRYDKPEILAALKIVVRGNDKNNAYDTIIQRLIAREDFLSASEWHFFLLRMNNFPTNLKIVEPLRKFLDIHDPSFAASLSLQRSLVRCKMEALELAASTSDELKLSREMINRIQGKTFGIQPAVYNDRLGARWFATKFVPLDIALNGVSALGIETIGPLSLQAIALRERDPSAVYARIQQLDQLGVSIGTSTYSKAIAKLSRAGEAELLQSLLEHDAHPDVFDDLQHVDNLLASYSERREITTYKMLLAVRTCLTGASLEDENFNMQLRLLAEERSVDQLVRLLEIMRIRGIPIHVRSVEVVVEALLRPGNHVHGGAMPIIHNDDGASDEGLSPADVKALSIAIQVLTRITRSNGVVPLTIWHDVLRRLCIGPRADDLEKLCIWLAQWYNTGSKLRRNSSELTLPVSRQEQVMPAQIKTTNAQHPLRMLFTDDVQGDIVDWAHRLRMRSGKGDFTQGVSILRRLEDLGVYINWRHIRHRIEFCLRLSFEQGLAESEVNYAPRAADTETLKSTINGWNAALGVESFSVELMRQKIEAAGGLRGRGK